MKLWHKTQQLQEQVAHLLFAEMLEFSKIKIKINENNQKKKFLWSKINNFLRILQGIFYLPHGIFKINSLFDKHVLKLPLLHILKDVVVLFREAFHPSVRPIIHHPSRHPSMARRRQSCGNWSHSATHPHKVWPARSPKNLSNPPSNRLLQLHPYPSLQVTLTPYICIQDHCSTQQSK